MSALAQLRHAYSKLAAGSVTDQKQFADGLIAPVIRWLEQGPAPVDVELAREVRRVNEPHLQPNHEALRSDGWREAAARIIDPTALKSWQAMFDYNLRAGDPEEVARDYADRTYKPDCDRALAKADAIAALPDPLVVLEGGGSARADLSRASSSPGPHSDGGPCEDCPPVGYPTDKTRCEPCPRRASDIAGPQSHHSDGEDR